MGHFVDWLTGRNVDPYSGKALTTLNPPAAEGTTFTLSPLPGGRNEAGAIYPDSQYASAAAAGYGRNELVYACIRERSENLPQSTLRVYPRAGGEPLDGHRLRQLLANPNPVMTEFEFFELNVTYLDLAGNNYWLIVRGNDGLPRELWPLRPDYIRIFPTGNPRIWDYGYILDPTSSGLDIVRIRRGDLIHIKYPNPLDPYFGQAPLRPAARAIALDNAATDHTDALLRNYAVPGVAVTTLTAIDDQLVGRLKRQWRRSFGGDNLGSPAFLQAGMDVKPLSLSLRDLEFPDLRAVSESRICAAFDVPPILVGAKVGLDRSTFTNYGEARKQLWEEAIFALQRRFGDHVARTLLPEFEGVGRQAVTVAWDNSSVLALQESESARWERATNALARGAITINDFRRTAGLDPVDGGDVFLIPAGVVPQPAPAVPAPAAIPAVPAAASAVEYAEAFVAELARNGKALT